MKSLSIATAIVASIGLANAQNSSVITSDTYFYGQSPPVDPPIANGTGTWAAAYSKAAVMVAQMTLEEKNNLTFGVTNTENGCSGLIAALPRVGFPGLCLSDAGNGLRATDYVSSWPSGIHAGASWNKNLTYQRAYHMAGEFKNKGVNMALGPVLSPLGRMALNGRMWEGFSSDPYLCGILGAESVAGMQDRGVIASTKHFIAYEQETNRNPTTTTPVIQSVSSNVDDKTLHELYLWPFVDAIHAGTGNIMCSYNRVNNSYACANSKLLNGILKEELGFQGFVVSDWGGQHSGVASALAGLDMAMPNAAGFWEGNMTIAIANGTVPESRLDDMATRIIATWYQLGQDSGDFDEPGFGMPYDIFAPHTPVIGYEAAGKDTLLRGAIEGHVLVKNTNNALPLKSPKLLSVYGYSATAPTTYGPYESDPYMWQFGYQSIPGDIADVLMTGNYTGVELPVIAPNGTLVSGGGSGSNAPAYIAAPFDALQQRAWEDQTTLYWDFVNTNATASVDANSEACIVVINAIASEGWDRVALRDDYSDALVNNIADQCANTIVVIHNAGPRLVDQFVDHPNVTGIIFAGLPGQDTGRALTQILYGDVSPSGKMPYTVPKNESDYGHLYGPDLPQGEYAYFPQSDFTEGVYIDYKYFEQKNITPRYEFGFGLTYTTFSYSNLAVSKTSGAAVQPYPTGETLQGGPVDLWDTLATVTADVSNVGDYDAKEVAQLYVGIPGAPPKQLRGFEKFDVAKKATQTVSFELTRRDLSEWDVAAQKWKLQNGTYNLYVGSSSKDLPLVGTLVF